MSHDKPDKPHLSQIDEDWQAGKGEKPCVCGLSLLRKAYNEHLKDGTHNSRLKPSHKESGMPA